MIFTVLSFRPLLVHGLVAAGTRSCAPSHRPAAETDLAGTRSCAPSHRPAAETDLAGAVLVGVLAAVV